MRWKTCIFDRSRGKSFPNLVIFSQLPDSPRDHRAQGVKQKEKKEPCKFLKHKRGKGTFILKC